MSNHAQSYDSPIKSIYYLIAGVTVFSLQDVIIKWISGKYPVNEIVLIRSCLAIIPILFIKKQLVEKHTLMEIFFHKENVDTEVKEKAASQPITEDV